MLLLLLEVRVLEAVAERVLSAEGLQDMEAPKERLPVSEAVLEGVAEEDLVGLLLEVVVLEGLLVPLEEREPVGVRLSERD